MQAMFELGNAQKQALSKLGYVEIQVVLQLGNRAIFQFRKYQNASPIFWIKITRCMHNFHL